MQGEKSDSNKKCLETEVKLVKELWAASEKGEVIPNGFIRFHEIHPAPLAITMEYATLGSLSGIRDLHPIKDENVVCDTYFLDIVSCLLITFFKTQIFHIGITILEVLVFLQRKNIIHRDVKSLNIVITEDGEVRLIDFGTCVWARKITGEDYMCVPNCPPEADPLRGKAPVLYAGMSDAFALGYELLGMCNGMYNCFLGEKYKTISHISHLPYSDQAHAVFPNWRCSTRLSLDLDCDAEDSASAEAVRNCAVVAFISALMEYDPKKRYR